jgi:putative toxin-antitoxin system antitoxin component (TIGR02293 family)
VTIFSDIFGSARIVGPVIPEATLRRTKRARKPLSKEHSERLYEIGRVVDAVSRAYHGDEERVRAFLTRPHPLLDGKTPFDLARSSSAGADAVLKLLHRAEAGVAL